MKVLNWGILGTGHIVNKMGPAIQQVHHANWLGVAGRNASNSQNMADTYQVKRSYDHYQSLIEDPDIDVVYIALLNHLHKEWTLKAIEAGKHVLVEKPFTLNEQEALDIQHALHKRSNPPKVMEAYFWRFHPAHIAVKHMIKVGVIGDIVLFNGHFSFKPPATSTRFKKEWGGGSLFDVGCYPMTWARYFMDDEPVEVDAKLTTDDTTGVDIRFVGLLHFLNGKTAQISSSFDMPHGSHYEILGTEGKIDVSFNVTSKRFTIVVSSPTNQKAWETDRIQPYVYQATYFNEAILKHTPLHYDIEDAIQNMRMIDALRKASTYKSRMKL